MNDRIKEFALQSGMIYPAMGEKSYTNFCHEKFAELIIQECVKVCEDGVNCAEDWDSSVWDQACINRGLAIKSHFGV
jgi:hypothetical protein